MNARCLLMSFLLCFAAACSEVRVGGPSGPSAKEPQPQEDVDSHIWMSATVYPEGYDWQLDTSSVDPGRVALLCDGKLSLLLEDSDSWSGAFVVAGHLYDASRESGRTVIRRDGELYRSWDGEELVWDMALAGGSFYCLCTSLDGRSVTLRKDGAASLSYADCWPDSGFYEDRGLLCFDIGGRKTGSVCGLRERFVTLSGVEEPVSVSAHTMGGALWLKMEYVLNHSWTCTAIGDYDRQPLHATIKPEEYSGFLYGGKSVLVEKIDSKSKYMILRDFKPLYESPEAFSRVSAVCDGDDVRALGRISDGSWALFSNGELTPLPEGTRPSTSGPPAFRYGRLIIPLTDRNGRAAVLDDGKLYGLSFNGRLNRVIIGRGSSSKLYLSY